ncbi:hypothetical protein EV646_102148 [Kribbella antiqua]|uniref:ANTAR domain-containing protein n=1 Tax=Kribbella antiqua TaxID=2512217 RepID=A0A4R2IXI8_9ACTN|nr:hypothetical protein [Kribbella antiqua]TCO50077.1 hypothetical protein EV646_102148 [Kribbella antiqua]
MSALTTSRELATKTAADLTLSYALRHLGIAAHMAGNLADEAAELAASAGAAKISEQIAEARSGL